MNWKIIVSIFLLVILSFSLVWVLRNNQYFSSQTSKKDKTIDSLIISLKNCQKNKDFKKISGEFILKDSKYAGFNFINPKIVSWTNEMDIAHPDTLKIYWLDNVTFFTQDIKKHNENCPPRVSIYNVISFNEEHLILKEINTSRIIDSADSILEFYKVKTSVN